MLEVLSKSSFLFWVKSQQISVRGRTNNLTGNGEKMKWPSHLEEEMDENMVGPNFVIVKMYHWTSIFEAFVIIMTRVIIGLALTCKLRAPSIKMCGNLEGF
ncbi:hypothetical protein Droror1_Dr00013046 [Drosera rotundifolia]